MLDRNEITQVRQQVIAGMAEVEKAIHANNHGSYTHLCAVGDILFYAHSPVGRVLHEFEPEAAIA